MSDYTKFSIAEDPTKEKDPKAASATTLEGQQAAASALMMQAEDKEASSNTNKAMNLAAKWIQLQAQFALRLQQQQQVSSTLGVKFEDTDENILVYFYPYLQILDQAWN